MTFTALFLAGKTAALCFRISPFPGSLLNSRLARLILVLLPLAFSTWVAITRVEDYVCLSPACLHFEKLIVTKASPQGRRHCRECYWHSFGNNLLPSILAQPLLCGQFLSRQYGMPEARSQRRIPWISP